MIGTQLAERVLLKALGNGADFAELFLEDSEACSLQMLNGNVEKAMSSRSCGAGQSPSPVRRRTCAPRSRAMRCCTRM